MSSHVNNIKLYFYVDTNYLFATMLSLTRVSILKTRGNDMNDIYYRKTIKVKYFSATNFFGARLKASYNKTQVTEFLDYSLDINVQIANIAKKIIKNAGLENERWIGGTLDNGDTVFVSIIDDFIL